MNTATQNASLLESIYVGKNVRFGANIVGKVEAVAYWRGDYRLTIRLVTGRVRYMKAAFVEVMDA